MNLLEFQKRISEKKIPIIVDLWAPWCGPCRVMEPALEQASLKYTGTVDIIKINADESPEVVKFLGVMGIPTVVGFADGKEILRRTGAQSAEGLGVIFDATLNRRKSANIPPAPIDRLIRSGAGLALIALGWYSGQSILLIGLGGVLMFSAVYDRCPIYRAVFPKLGSLFHHPK